MGLEGWRSSALALRGETGLITNRVLTNSIKNKDQMLPFWFLTAQRRIHVGMAEVEKLQE